MTGPAPTRSVFQLLDQQARQPEENQASYRNLIARAQHAERLGYDTFWLAEHHFSRIGTVPNPAVVLAALATVTTRIRLGPAVSVLPLRDPAQVAEDYALVDVLSGGRLRLGVGSGSQSHEFECFGVDFDGRTKLFDERIRQLVDCWSSAGEGAANAMNVRPIQPMAPVLVATNDADRARDLGRQGISIMTLIPPTAPDLSEIERRLAAHAEGLHLGGHEQRDIRAVAFVFAHVDESDEAARRTAAPALARILGLLAGQEIPDGEPLYATMLENGTGVFGSPDSAQSAIERLAGTGARHLAFLSGFGGIDANSTNRSLQLLAPG